MHIHAPSISDSRIRSSITILESITDGFTASRFLVEFWDGSTWGSSQPEFILKLNDPSALRNMLMQASELSIGESYMDGDFDIEGDWEAAFGFGDFLMAQQFSTMDKLRLGHLLSKLPSKHQDQGIAATFTGDVHSKERDRRAISFHYDISNDFYSLWLDRAMVYSCAYFRSKHLGIDTAQEDKLDYICRKLRLQRGDRILDIGCGWGALMIHAARHYGAHVFGITLSVPQAEFARDRFRMTGVADKCKVEVADYRDIDPPQQYDKLVSVGMFEHVGRRFLPEYFRRAWDLLMPGGVFLNHGIASSATFHSKGPSFIDKYVFPDGELVPLNVTLDAAEAAGFEVRDVESLREHYELTLRRWLHRLEKSAQQAKAIVGEARYRTWRLYLAGSAHGFRIGRLNLYQTLLCKPHHGSCNLPLTREDWYSPIQENSGEHS
jgi:cyclopropane-fatty-acyl-phospholipid synthase